MTNTTIRTDDLATALREAVDDITARHACLPKISANGLGKGWIASHESHRTAAEALVNHIRREHGAKIRIGMADASRLRLHGVTVTCTSGLSNLIRAWLAKAEGKLEEMGREGAA